MIKKLLFLLLFSLTTMAQTNLVPNNGFETWTTSTTLSNWIIENSVTQNTSTFSEGSKSAQLSITNSAAPPKITAQVPMTAGTTYTVKFKYKYVSANYSGQHPISLNISKNGSATTLSSSTFASNNDWTIKETTFTPDQNLSYDLSISIFTFDAAAFNVLIDDVQVYIKGTEQYTLIPDVNFENKLIALGIDSGATDGKVLTNSVNKLTDLNVSSSSITDLTGIQDFVALKVLYCYSNLLTSLNISKSLGLTSLYCRSNQLTILDVSKNLDLTSLSCGNNKLTSLDVTYNTLLTDLYCHYNKLSDLNVSKNINLRWLMFHFNDLKTIDVSENTKLDLLDCQNNKLTNLDISKNPLITELACENNQLTYLNLKNGTNKILDLTYSNFTNNPNLACIQVDDVTYSNKNWSSVKDATANFSIDCTVLIPITNFTAASSSVEVNGSITLTDSSINNPTSWAWEVTKSGSTTLTSALQNPTFIFVDPGTYAVKLTSTNGAGSNTKTVTNMITVTPSTLIPVANFTAATTTVNSNGSINFTDSSTNKPISWAWEVTKSGSTTLTSALQNPTFIFLDPGTYTVKLTATNGAGSNTKTVTNMITVTSSTLIPLANFTAASTSIEVNGSIALTDSSINNPTSWAWEVTKTGSTTLTSSLQNPTFTFVDAGTYTVKLTATNSAGSNTKTFANMINVFLSLHSNNFAITSKSETCLNSNNGEINIKATATFPYKATINGQNYSFVNNNLTIPNLTPGIYTVSVTITGETFEQNFTITIPKGATITGKSSLVANKVAIDITEGTAPFTVFLNGKPQFETNDSSFSLDLKQGGLLEVKTAKTCEGIYAKNITGIETVSNLSSYPNPTSGSFEIALPTSRKEVVIELYNLSSQLISKGTYTNENGKAKLSLEQQTAGVYIAKVYLDTPEYLKIIKK